MAESIPQWKPKGDKTDIAPKADKAPRGRATGKTQARLDPNRPFKYTLPKLRETLQTALGMATLALSTKAALAEDEVAERDADVLIENGEALIDSWMWLAERTPSVRRALELLCGGGGYATFAMANLTVVLSIAQNHGYYPAEWPTPNSLKSVLASMATASDDESNTSTDD